MLNFKKNKFVFQKKIIILNVFAILLITSCDLNVLKKDNSFVINENNQDKFKKLIIPKGMDISSEDPEYKIPYTDQDLKKEKIDILPPV